MTTLGTMTPMNLFAGLVMPQVVKSQIIEADPANDTTLLAGTVLAKRANTKFAIVNSAVPGETDPYCVLAEDTIVLAGTDKAAPAYHTGEFNEDALIFGGADTHATHEDAMRAKGMFIKSVVSA